MEYKKLWLNGILRWNASLKAKHSKNTPLGSNNIQE